MTLRDFYKAAIEIGTAADPRGRDGLSRHLREVTTGYERMSDREKRLFDRERLVNPFGDTRIVNGDPETELSRIVLGIDIEGSELLLASELTRRGKTVDAVVAHHGSVIAGGIASRHDTAIPQVHMAVEAGVPEPRAWKMVQQVMRKDGDSPWDLRILQIAEALEMPLMTVHSPADACLDELVHSGIEKESPVSVGALLEWIEGWPECQALIDKTRHGPTIDAGEDGSPVGKVYRCLYGGWNPTPDLFEALCRAGVGTFVVVASTDAFRELAGKYGANIVVIPHYPADNAGINIMLDRMMPDGDLFEIVEVGNYVRSRRER